MSDPDKNAFKILLIDDSNIDVELVERLCKRNSLDFPIVRAANGLDALEILKSPDEHGLFQPYVILLDINMPLMNGFELLEHLTKYGPDIDTPIYMMSGSNSAADKARSESYNVSGYIVKPITLPTLLKFVS